MRKVSEEPGYKREQESESSKLRSREIIGVRKAIRRKVVVL